MTQENFFIKYNWKFLDVDGVPYGNKFQCVDVIKQFFVEVLGVPAIRGNAIDYWNHQPAGFTQIKKTMFNRPNPGDIIIWNEKVNPLGHIAIANWTRFIDVGVFEQNNPLGSPCHFDTHNYKNVLGWLRPIPLVVKVTVGPPLFPRIQDSPTTTITIARIGHNLPPISELQNQVFKFTHNKLKIECKDYDVPLVSLGMMTQDDTYNWLSTHFIAETFVQFYYSSPQAPFATSYSFPNLKKQISTLPNNPPAQTIFYELSNCLWNYANDELHAGLGYQPDQMDPSEEFTQSKVGRWLPWILKGGVIT